MRDWEAFLDKFLQDTELPVLSGPGTVSHEDATSWAETQYDAFVERRRQEAETEADARYLDDLRASAKMLEERRKPLPDPKMMSSKRRRPKRKSK